MSKVKLYIDKVNSLKTQAKVMRNKIVDDLGADVWNEVFLYFDQIDNACQQFIYELERHLEKNN